MAKTTNLLKKSKIPDEIIGKVEDAVFELNDLDDHMGENLFALIYDEGASTILIAADSLKDLPFWASYYDYPSIPPDVDEDKLMVVSLEVENPQDLPYELTRWQKIAVVCDDWEFAIFDDMQKATEEIEFLLKTRAEVEIEDFIVFSYIELIPSMKVQMMERIRHYWRSRYDRARQNLLSYSG